MHQSLSPKLTQWVDSAITMKRVVGFVVFTAGLCNFNWGCAKEYDYKHIYSFGDKVERFSGSIYIGDWVTDLESIILNDE